MFRRKRQILSSLSLVLATSFFTFKGALADNSETRATIAQDTKTLRKYSFWCANNPQLVQKIGRCDADNDGISNQIEARYHTLPTFPDSDGDDRSDRSELLQGSDPLVAEDDGGCYPLYFYRKSKVTNKFNIPKGIIGSIPRGAILFKQLKTIYPISDFVTRNLDYPTLRALLKKPPLSLRLQGEQPTLTTAQLADLVAYLNKDKLNQGACLSEPTDPGSPGTPTPAPTNSASQTPAPTAMATSQATRTAIPAPTRTSYQWGYVYANTICADCHSLTFLKNTRSINTISSAIRNVTAMQTLLETDSSSPFKTRTQKIADLNLYLECTVNGGENCR